MPAAPWFQLAGVLSLILGAHLVAAAKGGPGWEPFPEDGRRPGDQSRQEGDTGEVYDMREGFKIVDVDKTSPAGLRASKRAGQAWLRANSRHSLKDDDDDAAADSEHPGLPGPDDDEEDYSDDRLDISRSNGAAEVEEDQEEDADAEFIQDSFAQLEKKHREESRTTTKRRRSPTEQERQEGDTGEAYDMREGFKIVDRDKTSPAGLQNAKLAGQTWLTKNARHSVKDEEPREDYSGEGEDEEDYSDDRLDISQSNGAADVEDQEEEEGDDDDTQDSFTQMKEEEEAARAWVLSRRLRRRQS